LQPTYTNIRLHDAGANSQEFVHGFRNELIERQIKIQEEELNILYREHQTAEEIFEQLLDSKLRFDAFHCILTRIVSRKEVTLSIRHNKKLCDLYNGKVPNIDYGSKVINLTNFQLDPDIEKIFQLGMNCHIKTKATLITKQIELEKLYADIKRKQESNEVRILNDEQLRTNLKQLGLNDITDHNKDLITKLQYAKIKELHSNDDIVIRKADKSNTFVILTKQSYNSKIKDILSNTDKFTKIRKDPTEDVKKRINKLIDTVNAVQMPDQLTKLEGHFEPGYMYGNPKIHKDKSDPPLRPIISQIGTPVYNLAKSLNSIIMKYMPKEHVIDSTYEFIEICKTVNNPKYLASLDVESLFTNVPVRETINIILRNVYENPDLRPPMIPRIIMDELLSICTTQCPFREPSGSLYVQCDGVSMGSPLGPTFASYYMCELENLAFRTIPVKPVVYCRYVDDCFLVINNIRELHFLKDYFEQNSVLNFTFETEIQKKLPFLDTLVSRSNDKITTSVYSKSTNSNECLNYNSLCPEKYKISVIRAFLHRAYAICSKWESFHSEVQRIRKLLTNNGFPIGIIDQEIRKYLDRKFNVSTVRVNNDNITLFYRNQYTSNFKADERNLKRILLRNVQSQDPSKELKLLIYYRNRKVRSLFIKNKMYNSNAMDRVVYQYTCNKSGCNSASYIGYTTCALAKRFYMHVQTGAIRKHNANIHSQKPLTRELLQTTTVIYRGYGKQDLTIAEALFIKQHRPSINQQDEGYVRVLNLF
jgi:hypothetical protein